MTNLLLREAGAIGQAEALSATHSSILLRLFVSAAGRVKQWYATHHIAVDTSGKRSRSKEQLTGEGGGGGVFSSEDWEGLQDTLVQSLPALLKRFRGDDSSTELLADLLTCCDLPPATAAGASKATQSLMKVCMDMFESVQAERSLVKLSGVLRVWLEGSGKQQQAHVRGVTRQLLGGLLDRLCGSVEEIVRGKDQRGKSRGSAGSGSVGRGSSLNVRKEVTWPCLGR